MFPSGTKGKAGRFSRMPRYYFHLHNDVDSPDDEGRELPDLEAARRIALHNARFTAGETVKDRGHLIGNHRIDIEDENGTVLDTVHFRDAVKIEG